MFNPTDDLQTVNLSYGIKYKKLFLCGMDETKKNETSQKINLEHRKIVTVYVEI